MERVDLRIEDDDSRSGGGFARLIFAIDQRPAPASLSVTIKRGGEADPWLGPSGWQASDHAFRALSVSAEPEGLCLVVGPEVVNQVEAFTSVMASLPDLGAYGVATWEATPGFAVAPEPDPDPVEVAFQLLPGGAIAFQPPAEDLGDLAPPARLEPGGSHLGIDYDDLRRAFQGRLEIDPKSKQARLLQGPGRPPERISFSATGNGGLLLKGGDLHPYKAHLEAGETIFGLESAPLVAMGQGLVELDPETLTARLVEDKTPTPAPPPPPTPSKKRGWILPLLVFLLVAGGTAAALVIMDKEPQQKQQAKEEDEKDPSDNKTTPKPGPKDLFSKGQTAFSAGKFDEARPLLRQAEAAGSREASLLLAQAIDSLGFETGLFAAADDIEALRLYGKACAKGEDPERAGVVATAKEDLKTLGEALKTKADKGDPIAADTLRGPFKEAEELCQ